MKIKSFKNPNRKMISSIDNIVKDSEIKKEYVKVVEKSKKDGEYSNILITKKEKEEIKIQIENDEIIGNQIIFEMEKEEEIEKLLDLLNELYKNDVINSIAVVVHNQTDSKYGIHAHINLFTEEELNIKQIYNLIEIAKLKINQKKGLKMIKSTSIVSGDVFGINKAIVDYIKKHNLLNYDNVKQIKEKKIYEPILDDNGEPLKDKNGKTKKRLVKIEGLETVDWGKSGKGKFYNPYFLINKDEEVVQKINNTKKIQNYLTNIFILKVHSQVENFDEIKNILKNMVVSIIENDFKKFNIKEDFFEIYKNAVEVEFDENKKEIRIKYPSLIVNEDNEILNLPKSYIDKKLHELINKEQHFTLLNSEIQSYEKYIQELEKEKEKQIKKEEKQTKKEVEKVVEEQTQQKQEVKETVEQRTEQTEKKAEKIDITEIKDEEIKQELENINNEIETIKNIKYIDENTKKQLLKDLQTKKTELYNRYLEKLEEEKKQQIEQLKKELENKEKEVEEIKKQLENLTIENEELREERNKLNNKLEEIQKDINKLKKELENKDLKIEELEKIKKDLNNKLDEYNKTVEKLNTQIRKLNNKITKLETQNKKLIRENERLKTENEKLEKSLEVVKKERDERSTIIDKQKEQIEDLEKQIQQKNAKIKDYEENYISKEEVKEKYISKEEYEKEKEEWEKTDKLLKDLKYKMGLVDDADIGVLVEVVNEELDRYEKINDEFREKARKLDDENFDLKNKIDDLEKEIETLKNNTISKEEHNKKLKEEREKVKKTAEKQAKQHIKQHYIKKEEVVKNYVKRDEVKKLEEKLKEVESKNKQIVDLVMKLLDNLDLSEEEKQEIISKFTDLGM